MRNWYDFCFGTTQLFEKNYIDPKSTNISFPKGKNNLILIYLESIESSMQSKKEGGLLDINYIPELTKLAKENINFSATNNIGGGIQASFTGWTIASLVTSNSGVPLKIPKNRENIKNYKNFLPRIQTLGDILKNEGYNRTLLLGSDSKFSGIKNFFTIHGNFKIMDYIYFKEHKMIPKNYFVWWGIEDYKLYNFAKDEVLRLSNEKNPFVFVLNTLDTHTPDGYLDSHCELKYDNQYANVISFTSKQAYDFVRWVQSQPFYKNTTIVILGDHLTMDPHFFKNIKGERYPYNCFINSKKSPIKMKNRLFTTFDLFPTILESIGAEINTNGLGLGRSLFGKQKTLIEKMGEDKFNSELNKSSKKYDNFWITN